MKTIDIEEIKNKIAERNGYGKYFGALSLDNQCILLDEVAEEYAKQCCDLQIKACAEKIMLSNIINDRSLKHTPESKAILSTPNVAEKP